MENVQKDQISADYDRIVPHFAIAISQYSAGTWGQCGRLQNTVTVRAEASGFVARHSRAVGRGRISVCCRRAP